MHSIAKSPVPSPSTVLEAPVGQSIALAPSEFARLFSQAEQLARAPSLDTLLRDTVEVGRAELGLERLRICLAAPQGAQLVGTWGTGERGETVAEHSLRLALSPTDLQAVHGLSAGQSPWLVEPLTTHYVVMGGRRSIIGRGWAVSTPLVHGGVLLGMAYNDAALTHAPVSESAQLRLSVLCSLLSSHVAQRGGARVDGHARRRVPSQLVSRAQKLIAQHPALSAKALASELRVTPAHLARCFKDETRTSIVSYRNQMRVARFIALVESGGIRDAAFAAGFHSYAQFHRVFRELVGTSPAKYLGAVEPSSRGS